MFSTARQYRQELGAIKRLLLEYRVLELEQIYCYFRQLDRQTVKKLISSLRGIGQLYLEPGRNLAALNQHEFENGFDRKQIASFWALLWFGQEIRYHTRSEYPSQLYLLCNDGREFEVVYASVGDEGFLNSILGHRKGGDVKYLVVVESPGQIELLNIQDVEWFCTVGKQGKITRYIQEA